MVEMYNQFLIMKVILLLQIINHSSRWLRKLSFGTFGVIEFGNWFSFEYCCRIP